MSRTAPPATPTGSEPPLTALREPDVSGLALWSSLLVASSALLVFFATEPAYAWPNVQPASASAPDGSGTAASLPEAGQVQPPRAQPGGTDGDPTY